MELKYSSKYMTISVDKEKRYIETRKTTLTDMESDAEYKIDILNWAKILQLEEPLYQLMDERNMNYLIVPEIQTWVNEMFIIPSAKRRLRKIAILESNDLFAQLSIKQVATKFLDKEIMIEYFRDEHKAKEWLFLAG